MPEHELKTWPSYFRAVLEGRKTFEVRRADRDFEVGDTIVLKEWDPDTRYTGRTITARITYLMRGGEFGLIHGYCAMSIDVESTP